MALMIKNPLEIEMRPFSSTIEPLTKSFQN